MVKSKSNGHRTLWRQWLIGVAIGTAIIGFTSPLFVRSYLPKVADPTRGVVVLQSGSKYRWTSEGYADTAIGPHGLAGSATEPKHQSDSSQSSVNSSGATSLRIALWGDSQAEGMCVSDEEKICGQLIAISKPGAVDVWNLARSGDDCNHWLHQIETVSGSVQFDAHVFLVVEWTDWFCPVQSVVERPLTRTNQVFSAVPAFAIQAARNVLLDDSNAIRKLRFRPGPESSPATSMISAKQETPSRLRAQTKWLTAQLDRLRSVTNAPCLFLYAPKVPAITEGRLEKQDPDTAWFDAARIEIENRGWTIKDLRNEMIQKANQGDWPRGFHNGQFGVGHYNAVGNRVIAKAIDDAMLAWELNSAGSEN